MKFVSPIEMTQPIYQILTVKIQQRLSTVKPPSGGRDSLWAVTGSSAERTEQSPGLQLFAREKLSVR